MQLDNITFIGNDVVLPEQFFPNTNNPSGCQRLLMAIFEEAMTTLKSTFRIHNNHHTDVLWNAVVEWIVSDDMRYASFVYCCHHMGVDPMNVRRALLKLYGLELRIPHRRPTLKKYIPLLSHEKRGRRASYGRYSDK